MEVGDETAFVQNVHGSDSERTLSSNSLEGQPSSSLLERLRKVSEELECITSSKTSIREDRSKSNASCALRGPKLMTENVGTKDWSQVEKHFDELAIDGKLPKMHFSQCIGMHESKEFADELFHTLARRRSITAASITKDELREFLEQITDQSFDSRLQTFLDMVDKSADGRISKEEVKEIIDLSASNKLSAIQERAEEYAALIVEELQDPDNLGYIELYKFKMLLMQTSEQSIHSTRDSSKVVSQKLVLTTKHNPINRGFQALVYFVEDNWKRLWVMALWLSICTTLFTWKFIQYKHFIVVYHIMGYYVPLAKGVAETLKFNMALILLLVCKNTITWLRSKTKLGMVVPFDDSINFHKVIAFSIAIGSVFHTLLYLIYIFPRLLHVTSTEYEALKQFYGDKRPNNYWRLMNGVESWTGVVMVVLMAITYTLAHSWFRRNKLNLPTTLKKLTGFNTFWYSHHLYVIIYVLLIIHGHFLFLVKKWYEKTTWMYLIIPMTLYICERLLRVFRSGFKSIRILKVAIYPGNVLALHVSKPQGFKYISGQYIYVNCPDVSPFEWHPLSITSAPGDDYLSIHVRTLGDWTSQLKVVFAKACQKANDDQCDLQQIDMLQGDNKSRVPRILIDGPYGAPAQDYKNYEVLLLIGLGIGVTPLISILKDVLSNNIKQQQDLEEGVIDNGVKNKKRKPFATKQAYFNWVTQNQGSFEWFKGFMNEVEENDKEGVIELHNYCTRAYEEGGAQSALISWLQSLHYDKKHVDIVSRTRIRTYFTRPNWHNVFKHIAVKHPNKRVGVFYCGAHELAGELRRFSLDFSRKTNTKFDFHKENF